MLELLETVSREPRLIGVATIGGVVSLAYLVVTLVWRGYRAGSPIFIKSLKSRRLTAAKYAIQEYKMARLKKLKGMGEIYVMRTPLDRAAHTIISVQFSFAVCILNFGFYLSGKGSALNAVLGCIFLIVFVGDAFSARKSMRRALNILEYASLPSYGFIHLRKELRSIRRAWFP